MSLASDYTNAMTRSDIECCIRIEKEFGLFGYPPELVHVALEAIDSGEDPESAISDYIDSPDNKL